MRALILAGGTGGAKLAAGAQDLIGAELTVLANTGDDVELLGVHVSPDPDLCTYWLAGEIDEERGWGVAGDSAVVLERLRELGAPSWFTLGDRDLAVCLERRRLLDAGVRQTEVQGRIATALGAQAAVLPMCDGPVRTVVQTASGSLGLQEYLVREQARPPIEGVGFEGVELAAPSPEARSAIAAAEVIIIGPSNPIISIGPILAVPGMRELIADSTAPVVAVSPFVARRPVKGPTDRFMLGVGLEPSAGGVLAAYEGLLDGFVADAGDGAPPKAPGLEVRVIDTAMEGRARRREVAAEVLGFAAELRTGRR